MPGKGEVKGNSDGGSKRYSDTDKVVATLKTWGCGPLVWGGDANTHLHGHKCKIEGLIGESILRRSNLKRAMARDMVRRRARFVEFIEKHELVITTNSFITNNSKLYTHKNNGSKVRIRLTSWVFQAMLILFVLGWTMGTIYL